VTRGQLPQRAGSLGLNGGGSCHRGTPRLIQLKNETNLKKINLHRTCSVTRMLATV